MVPGLQEGEPRWPNRVRIPTQRGEEAGQVCILNRTRLGKLIKISSRPNWEKPEEAGSCGGGQQLKDMTRLQRKRDGRWGYCRPGSSEDFSASSSAFQDRHIFLPPKPDGEGNFSPSFRKRPIQTGLRWLKLLQLARRFSFSLISLQGHSVNVTNCPPAPPLASLFHVQFLLSAGRQLTLTPEVTTSQLPVDFPPTA